MIQLQIMISTLMLIFILSSLSGCGGSSGRETVKKKLSHERIDLDTLSGRVDLSYDTPKALALIIKTSDKDTSTCTGFLIDSKTMITNSHCVENVRNNKNCRDDLMVIAQSDNEVVESRCSKIIFKSSRSKDFTSPDYAVVELTTPIEISTYFNISREGISNSQELTIHSMNLEIENPNTDYATIIGDYAKTQCRNDVNRMQDMLPRKKIITAPIVLGIEVDAENLNCLVIGGNSGSPVVNNTGNVVGTAFAAPSTDEVREKLGNFAVIVNFSCLKFHVPVLDANIDPSCSESALKMAQSSSALFKTLGEL